MPILNHNDLKKVEEYQNFVRTSPFANATQDLGWEKVKEGWIGEQVYLEEDGKIIAGGRNRRETGKNALYHAELSAIDAACRKLGGWRLIGCDLYVTLEPCPMCAGAIIASRIEHVYFGAYDKKAGSFGSIADFNAIGYNHKPEVTGGVLEDECAGLLSQFFKNLRLIKKNSKG